MQVVHRAAAGPLVQVVDVLGDDGDIGIVLLGNRPVAVVGLDPLTRWWRHRYHAHTRSGFLIHPSTLASS